MPAIELGRLQQQVTQLSDLFQEPASYFRGVEDLLKDHGVPVHRQGRVKGLRPVLPSYVVPPPLLKLLTLEMSARARQYPQAALAIADSLWARETMETRQLAINLLGSIQPTSSEEITNRLQAWASENREQTLVPELAGNGTRTLQAANEEVLLSFASELLDSGDHRKQIFCLGLLQNLVSGNHFANLPALFDLLVSTCKNPDRQIRPELASLLLELARSSPKETEYFLQHVLTGGASENARWLVRQAIRALPEDAGARLQLALSG